MLLLAVGQGISKDTRELLEMSLEELMNIEISTASKHEQLISETPATVYVFTEQDFQENGYHYLSDILRYIPNMDVHWSGGPQYVLETRLRGLEEFVVLMDGVRINPASSVPPHFGYVLPLNHVKRVEVIMGPSSALYGADACAGIINIITSDPSPDTAAFRFSVLAGNQSQLGVQTFLQKPAGPLAIQLSLSGFHLNDNDKTWWPYLKNAYAAYPTSLSEHYTTDYDNPITSYSASGKVKSGNNILGFNFWNREVEGGLRLDPAKFAANRFARTSAYQYLLYLQNQTPLGDRSMLRSRLAYDYYLVRYNFYYTRSNLDDPKYYRESADRLHWLEELDYRLAAHTRLLFGLEAQSTVSVPKAYNSVYDSTGRETGFGEPISDNEALTYYQIRSGGLFLQAENTLFQGHLKTNVGIRSDYYSTFGMSVNPRASVYYRLAASTSLRLMYGTAFFTPPPDKMYRTTYVPGQRYQTTNEGLKPRTNANYEAAIDYKPFSRLSLEGRAFRNEVDDEIVFVRTNEPYVVGTDTVKIYQYRNIGKARYEGVEGLVRLMLPLKIKAQSGISYLRGYTRENLDSEKKDLDLLSQIKATWNIHRTFFKNVQAGVQGLHLLYRRAAAGNSIYPDGEMPGVFIINFNVNVDHFWRGMGGHLKVENVLNREWSDIPGTSSSASPELPQPLRRIFLELNWHY